MCWAWMDVLDVVGTPSECYRFSDGVLDLACLDREFCNR